MFFSVGISFQGGAEIAGVKQDELNALPFRTNGYGIEYALETGAELADRSTPVDLITADQVD